MDSNTLAKRSLRDPAGSLYEIEGRMIRFVKPAAVSNVLAALRSPTCRSFFSSKNLAQTDVLASSGLFSLLARNETTSGSKTNDAGLLLEHERLWFPSYPHEWCPEMLWEAGRLTLDMALKLGEEGLELKDATPFNILFRGTEPVFVDILSIERRAAEERPWLAFGQFVRSFLSPL